MFGLSGAGKLVILAVEHTKPCRNASVDKCSVHLQALIDRTAVVLIRIDEQRRRLDVFRYTTQSKK